MSDPRVMKVAGITAQLASLAKQMVTLRAERARVTWSLITDPSSDATIASVAREIGEPEIRFRKSVIAYRDGVPKFKRPPAS